jgi:hypothetical protein
MFSSTFDWSQTATEIDVPADAVEMWAWLALTVPAEGTLWIDDGRLEVLGPATDQPVAPASVPKARRAQPTGKTPVAKHH